MSQQNIKFAIPWSMEKEAKVCEIGFNSEMSMVVSPDIHCRAKGTGMKKITHNSYEYKKNYFYFLWLVQMIMWTLDS